MKLALKIFKYFTLCLIIIIIASSSVIFIQRKFSLVDYPNIFGYSILSVNSGSMTPTIMVNDKILTKVVKADEVKENDIIVYSDEEYLVTHRLISINKDKFITKGDANNTSEDINNIQLVAKVILYGKKFSTFISILLNPLILIVISIVGIVIPDYVIDNIKDKDRK